MNPTPINSSPKTVTLTLNSKDVQNVLSMFITNKIPFNLSFSDKKEAYSSDKTEPVQLPTNKVTSFKSRKVKQNDEEIVKAIHDKYLNNDFFKDFPKETEIAVEYGIKLSKFRNIFKALYEKRFYQYFMDRRIQHSAKLLLTGISVNEVSKRVGYSHPIKFNKMFQQHFGITPKKYQMQQRRI